MIEINGKVYPMWSQFVERKDEWIGGEMIDIDSIMGEAPVTEITDVTLEPSGNDSAMICFHGKDYGCGSDVQFIGVGGPHPTYPNHLALYTQFGNTFLIKKNSQSQVALPR